MTEDARHILMVLESWGKGGTESFVRQLVDWLADNTDLRISVCLLKAGATARQAAVQALPIAERDVHVLGAGNAVSVFLRFLRLLRRLRPDVCHLHLYSSLLPAVVASRCARAPCIVTTLHMPLWNWSPRHRLAWRLAVAMSHKVTGNSSATLRSAGRQPGSKGTHLVPPPLPTELLHASSRAIGSHDVQANDSSWTISGIGRLSREKCWDTLLRALHLLETDNPGAWRLGLFGDGPEREVLEKLAESLGIAAIVRFEGFLPFNQLVDGLSDCDISVLPSRFEGLGMAAIEAMALGIPTVTSDFDASADFIKPGVTGRTFPRGDAKALARLLERYRSHPEEAAAIAERGRSFVRKRFNPDRVFSPVLTAYGVNAAKRGAPVRSKR